VVLVAVVEVPDEVSVELNLTQAILLQQVVAVAEMQLAEPQEMVEVEAEAEL
jgi:hypothetical protein